jgi:peptidoglycan lytic transglycosylase
MMQNSRYIYLLLAAWLGLFVTTPRLQADPWYSEEGQASWYGKEFVGRKTAGGERFSPQEMTAAHRNLPIGTKVIVENEQTGEATEVKITDRGPYADKKRRIIDLSHAAADSIGLVQRGTGRVRVTVSEPAPHKQTGKEELNYEVQVGAFKDQAAAQQVLAQVQPRFPEAYVQPRGGPSGPYYRVRVGPFDTEEQAKKVGQALKRQGHLIFLDEVPE